MTLDLLKRRGPLERALNKLSPNSTYGKTIVQLFLHEPQRHTTYTFTNVASLYAPKGAAGCRYELTLFGEQGERVGRTSLVVPAYGTASVRLAEHLPGPLPRHGILVARLRNAPRLSLSARHLGAITPHFYALFHAPDMSSLALVHPQTGLAKTTDADTHWHSNLLVEGDGLESLEAWQINPTPVAITSTIELYAGATRLAAYDATLPAMGSRSVRFEKDVLAGHAGPLHIAVDGMTTPNAKPILFHHFAAGGFGASHG